MWHQDPRQSPPPPIAPEPPTDSRPAPMNYAAPDAPTRAVAPSGPGSLQVLGYQLSVQQAGCLALCGVWVALVHLRAADLLPRLCLW